MSNIIRDVEHKRGNPLMTRGLLAIFSVLSLAMLVIPTNIFFTIAICESMSGTVLSDEFDSSPIDNRWALINPRGDNIFNLTANPGFLRIYVTGDDHDLNIPSIGNQYAPRVLQNISGDFVIETKFLFSPVASNQLAGILLWSNSTYFVRFERGYTDTYPHHLIRVREALAGPMWGGWAEHGKKAYEGSVTYLRIERRGNKFTFSYDPQDSTWTPLTFDAIPLDKKLSVGLFVLVQATNSPIYADFDYFRVFQGWPSAPRSLEATASNRLITLSWLPPSDSGGTSITNYKIYRGSSSNNETFFTTVGNVTTYTDTELIEGQEYYYKVSAVTAVGEGGLSNEAKASPLFTPISHGEEAFLFRAAILIAAFLATVPVIIKRRSLNLRNIKTWFKERKRDVAIVLGWTFAVALILIRIYLLFYARNPLLQTLGVPLLSYAGPMFEAIDLALLFMVSVVAGIMLMDMERIFYGYVASTIFSFVIAVSFAFLYIWYVLKWVWIFEIAHIAFGWEWVVFWAGSNLFRAIFPFPLIFSFLGAFFGALLRNWLKP